GVRVALAGTAARKARTDARATRRELTRDAFHRHRALVPLDRDERRPCADRSVAAGFVLLAFLVALPTGAASVAGAPHTRLRVPHAPPLRSLPLPVDAPPRPPRARPGPEVRRRRASR